VADNTTSRTADEAGLFMHDTLEALTRGQRLAYEEWRLTHPPIMGGAPDDEDNDAEDGDTGTHDDPSTLAVTDDRAPEISVPINVDNDDDNQDTAGHVDHIGDGTVPIQDYNAKVAELNRLRKEAAARERAARTAQREKLAAEGKWKDIAEAMTTERDAAFQERDDAYKTLNDLRMEIKVTKIAGNLGFRDPTDAARFIDDDIDLASDGADRVIEHNLRQVAKKKPYLVDQQRRSGAPVNGARGATPQEQANSWLASVLRGANPSQD
jgi:hypothetical protein